MTRKRSIIESLERRLLLSSGTQTFTIDTALSSATGSGTLAYPTSENSSGQATGPTANAPLEPLYGGSFTNNAVGFITVQTTADSIQFINADIAGQNTAGDTNTFGIPVNFAGSFAATSQTPTGTADAVIYAQINDLAVSLTSGALPLSNGSFSNSGEDFDVTTGSLGLSLTGTLNGVVQTPEIGFTPLTNYATSVANQTSLPSTLTINGDGTETLTINATGSFTETFGPFTATLNLTGQIVATYTPPVAPAVTAAVANDILTVQGTPNNDFIQIKQKGETIKVLSSNASIGTFDATNLTQIQVFGNAGDDVLKIAGSVAVPALLSGGAGADTILASSSNDTLEGGTGADSIATLAADDIASGGKGADSLASDSAGDSLSGGKGADSLFSSNGNDSLSGAAGDDTILSANQIGDSIDGGAGTNTIVNGQALQATAVSAARAGAIVAADNTVHPEAAQNHAATIDATDGACAASAQAILDAGDADPLIGTGLLR